MASKTFNQSLTMPNTAPVGNVPTTVSLHLTPAEATTLRQLRDGFIGTADQTTVTGVDRTLRILLQKIGASLASAP